MPQGVPLPPISEGGFCGLGIDLLPGSERYVPLVDADNVLGSSLREVWAKALTRDSLGQGFVQTVSRPRLRWSQIQWGMSADVWRLLDI